MRAVILAGRLGTRLSEETAVRPKPMVEIGERPILWHILKTYSHYGNALHCLRPLQGGETLSVNLARVHRLPIKTARPFNNYRPGLRISDGRAIPDFARDILADNDIVMPSSGDPIHTFCYIADAVAGYYKILVKGLNGEPSNIGIDKPEVSIADLADKMATIAQKHLGYKGKVIHRPSNDSDYLVDNPIRRCPDITKARSELGLRTTGAARRRSEKVAPPVPGHADSRGFAMTTGRTLGLTPPRSTHDEKAAETRAACS